MRDIVYTLILFNTPQELAEDKHKQEPSIVKCESVPNEGHILYIGTVGTGYRVTSVSHKLTDGNVKNTRHIVVRAVLLSR